MTGVERNIVFLYPLSAKLKELKESLEQDEEYIVYELDAVNEYTQLVGVLEHSITFSSDLKKTEQYLETSKSFIKTKNSRNIILQESTMLPHIFSKYQKNGLNEQIKEEAPVKNILHKINVFFNVFDQQLKREEEEKNKATTDFSHAFHFDNQQQIGSKPKENEKLHVEKMAIMDDEPEQRKKKKGFDASFLSSNLGSGKIGSKTSGIGFMNSMFDQLQRRNVMQFNPSTDSPKLKKVDFKAIDSDFKRKKYNPLDLPGQDSEAKKRKKLDLNGVNNQKNRKKFEEVERDLNNKRGKFEPVERDLNKKRKSFEEQLRELDQRKAKFNPQNLPERKRRKFDEIERDLNQRRAKFEPIQREVERKKLNLEEIEREISKKKLELPEFTDDKSKPKWEELHELNRKRAKLLDELEDEQKKAKTFLEQELEGLKKKKLELDDLENEQNKGKFEEAELDLNKKKNNFTESDVDNEKKNGQIDELEINKKKHDFNEVENEDKDLKKLNLDEIEEEKKNLSFQEIGTDKNKRAQNNLEFNQERKSAQETILDRDDNSYEKELVYDAKKDLGEQTLDYSEFKKEKKGGDFNLSDDLDEALRSTIEDNLEEPELFFYDAQTYGLEFLVLFNQFLLTSDIQISKLFKFIHFAFIKEYSADISLYLNTTGVQENMMVSSMLKLYEGHLQAQTVFTEDDYLKQLAQNETLWATINLPTWEDDTFELEPNSFIYPYYQDGVHLAFAVIHFKTKVKDRDQAKEVESLLMMLKGSILASLSERKGA